MIAAVDVGGTRVRCALVHPDTFIISHRCDYLSRDFASLEQILEDYLAKSDRCHRLALGVAGPVIQGKANLTNLPWSVDLSYLQKALDLQRVVLINDLEAHAYGLNVVTSKDIQTLQVGDEISRGDKAIIAAGTGLGEAVAFWNGEYLQGHATEGGHADFAPSTTEDLSLLRYLWKQYTHVSWEAVISGSLGLPNILNFVNDELQPDQNLKDDLSESKDFGSALYEAAKNGNQTAKQCFRIFVRNYGSESGNLALQSMCLGGLYIGGGIAPKILDVLGEDDFIEAFVSKGRFRSLLERVPIHIILSSQLGLQGAAYCCAKTYP